MADYPDVVAMGVWLADPGNAEPCSSFPIDAARVSGAGMYAWHGDAVADELIGGQLGWQLHPLFVDQAGSDSRRYRPSRATLSSAVLRRHLHGSTQASSFRRSLGAVLWNALELRCERPRMLDADSNARLTAWMLAHLSVSTLPVADRGSLWLVAAGVQSYLDPVLNLERQRATTPSRRRLRLLRRAHFTYGGDDADFIDRIRKLRAFAADQDSGGEFLQRRLAQEQRRFELHLIAKHSS